MLEGSAGGRELQEKDATMRRREGRSIAIGEPVIEWVHVIDRDVMRRGGCCFHLRKHGFSATPYESVDEFAESLPTEGVVLVYDDEGAVASVAIALARSHGSLPVVACSEDPDPSRIVAAVIDGAIEYCRLREADGTLPRAINNAIERAARRSGVLSGAAHLSLVDVASASSRIDRLSPREREILAGMVEGVSSRIMAEYLEISPRTVEMHRAKLLSKMGVRRSTEAIRLALEAGVSTRIWRERLAPRGDLAGSNEA